MDGKLVRDRTAFEIFLIIVTLGTVVLFALLGPYRIVILNLFYLPIILSGYFLGRSHAGILALLCVLTVTIATTLVSTSFAAFDTPLMIGLVLAVWGATLGLTAILVGTLCDERATTVRELHRAYVGVVEVLSKYLQGGNPRNKARSVRIAEMSQLVAEELNLSQKHVDDIRVAALLHELGDVEITTQVIHNAFETLGESMPKHTFRGTELVHSLASVLEGALPLLANQDEAVRDYLTQQDRARAQDMPLGARIIRAARTYDDARSSGPTHAAQSPAEALCNLRVDLDGTGDEAVIDALKRAVEKSQRRPDLVFAGV
jgi:hypothetical protein